MILFPKFINIRRGQYICAVLGVAACPWILQNSANNFVAFLGGYSIFLGPVAGILISDCVSCLRCEHFFFVDQLTLDFEYILRRRRLDIPALYSPGYGQYWRVTHF